MLVFNRTADEFKRSAEYTNIHHMTQLPDSLNDHVKITTDKLARMVQEKIDQQTFRDAERYQLMNRLFKCASANGVVDVQQAEFCVTKDEFLRVLLALGLTVNAQQSDALFDRYNVEKDGRLTVKQFLVRSVQQGFTHPWRHVVPPPEFRPPGPAQGGPPLRPHTPECDWSIEMFLGRLRDKMRTNNPSPFALSVPRCRRNLGQIFESVDRRFERTVSPTGLKRVLDLVNFPVSRHHLALLLREFPVPNHQGATLFDYPRFIRYVHPQESSNTSLYMDYDADFVEQGYHHGNQKVSMSTRGMTPPGHGGRMSTPLFEERGATPQIQTARFYTPDNARPVHPHVHRTGHPGRPIPPSHSRPGSRTAR